MYEETRDALLIEVQIIYGNSAHGLFGLFSSLARDMLTIGVPFHKDRRGTIYILRKYTSKTWEASQIYLESNPKNNFG